MIFQICSNLRLSNLNNKLKFKDILVPKSTILFLAGDIGMPTSTKYKKFIEYVSKNFEHVFLIAGTFEYKMYRYDIKTINKKIRDICNQYKNVYFLNNQVHEVGNFSVIGSVLWGKLNGENQKYIENKQSELNNIKYNNKKLWISDLNKLNDEAVHFINKTLEEQEGTNKIVFLLTNYIPTINNKLVTQIKGNIGKFLFSKSLKEQNKFNLITINQMLNKRYETYFFNDIKITKNLKYCIFGKYIGSIKIVYNNTIYASNSDYDVSSYCV